MPITIEGLQQWTSNISMDPKNIPHDIERSMQSPKDKGQKDKQ
jgi:hypothetical protein